MARVMAAAGLPVWEPSGQQPLQLSAAPSLAFHQLDIAQRLAPFNLQLAAGERVVLQGASGSGKSSLLQAVLGFLPYGGEIRINQQSLLTLRRADWHQQLGFLSQQPQLLHGNLADNLRLAAPEASDAQLVAVLDQVALWPLIRQLPLQLQTPMGERGLGLSGGQLSRLALAQLLLRDTPVWLLDEPTAHL